jgi:hypothetical protein
MTLPVAAWSAANSMAGVVVGATFDLSGAHRQQRLGAVERLDLQFLVDTQHHRAFGRRQMKADDIAHLLDEQRAARRLRP